MIEIWNHLNFRGDNQNQGPDDNPFFLNSNWQPFSPTVFGGSSASGGIIAFEGLGLGRPGPAKISRNKLQYKDGMEWIIFNILNMETIHMLLMVSMSGITRKNAEE